MLDGDPCGRDSLFDSVVSSVRILEIAELRLSVRWLPCSPCSRRRLASSYQVTRCADSSINNTAPCGVSLADKSRYFRILPASCVGVRPVLQQQMRSLPQMAQLEPQRAASSVVAAALALALSAANPMMTHASIEQPAVVRCSSGHRDVVLGLCCRSLRCS